MMRSAGKLVGTAAGVAASGPASQSQCRAQQPRQLPQHAKDEPFKGAFPTTVLPFPEEELEGDWLLTDVKRDVEGEHVVFGPGEIDETLNAVLAYAGFKAVGEDRPQNAHGEPRIRELDAADSEIGSDDQADYDANLHIQAAEMQLAPAFKQDFTRALSNLLHNPEVQSACLEALRNDPSFTELLADRDLSVDVPVQNFSLLPVAAQHAAQAEENDSSASVASNLAEGLVRLGETIKQKAAGARDLLGRLLIGLGFRVHALLGRPFGTTPLEDSDPERLNKNAEAVGNALITIACAILALVLVKRVHRVRFV